MSRVVRAGTFADLNVEVVAKEIGESDAAFDVKTIDECAATHVAAAFDSRLDGTRDHKDWLKVNRC